MVQETIIAEGTDVMFSDGANDSITALAETGENIANLQRACTTIGGTKKTKKNKKNKKHKKN